MVYTSKGLLRKAGFSGVVLLLITLAFVPATVQAHCDSEQGPVAMAARQALEQGDVTLILPYVAPGYEAELTEAFEQALEVRGLSEAAQELADNYFVETAVRLHREGEGAPYTGVTQEPTPEAILIADGAMESGSLDALYSYLNDEIRSGIEEQYHAVLEAREHAAAEGTVEANRERVEAELMFEKYVYELYLATAGSGGHDAEGATAAHNH